VAMDRVAVRGEVVGRNLYGFVGPIPILLLLSINLSFNNLIINYYLFISINQLN